MTANERGAARTSVLELRHPDVALVLRDGEVGPVPADVGAGARHTPVTGKLVLVTSSEGSHETRFPHSLVAA